MGSFIEGLAERSLSAKLAENNDKKASLVL